LVGRQQIAGSSGFRVSARASSITVRAGIADEA